MKTNVRAWGASVVLFTTDEVDDRPEKFMLFFESFRHPAAFRNIKDNAVDSFRQLT